MTFHQASKQPEILIDLIENWKVSAAARHSRFWRLVPRYGGWQQAGEL